jgi:hypothetical protein
MFGLKLAQTKPSATVTQLMTQHTQGAKGSHLFIGGIGIGFIQLRGDTFQKLCFGVIRIQGTKLLPLGILSLLHKPQQVFRIQGQFTAVVFRLAQQPAIGKQMTNNVVLEG